MVIALLALLVAAQDAVTVNTKTRVYAGEGVPELTVVVHEKIAGASLRLKRDDGERFDFKVPPSKKGHFTFKLTQAPGTSLDYEGELEVRFFGAEVGSIPLKFTGEVIVPLAIETSANAKDIAARSFKVKANRPIARIEMVLVGELGLPAGRHVFTPKAPAAEFVVSWPETKIAVLRIDAQFFDAKNVGRNMQLYPWYVEIAHEDVSFPTNSADVPPEEAPKLQAAHERIIENAKKVIGHAPVKLFVIGYTDTVGPPDKNQLLSVRRARSIAQYFREHGFTAPVVFTGLGERGLAVATPDETDNAQNRRARYVLAIDPPDLGLAAQWSQL